MIRVAHIITDTDTGGAELMLAKLVRNMDSSLFTNDILSLLPVDNVGESLRNDGFTVESPNMHSGLPSPASFVRIAKWLRKRRPAVIQTWMYHSDLLGGIAGHYLAGMPVIWNIRQSNLDPLVNSSSTIHSARICARLSKRVPSAIVCGSEAAHRTHNSFGYYSEQMEVIPNGFDTDFFCPDPVAKLTIRRELNIPDNAIIVGLVARFDPQKDHHNFICAAKILSKRNIDKNNFTPVYFVLCGENIEWSNNTLKEWIGEEADGAFGHRVRLLGRRHDLNKLYASFDVSGTSSLGEGFPNVVGEAMACGVPCVVTDVGDSASIVGNSERVVPPKNSEALASAWEKLLTMDPEARRKEGLRARKRIETYFSISAAAKQYENLYTNIFRQHYGESL